MVKTFTTAIGLLCLLFFIYPTAAQLPKPVPPVKQPIWSQLSPLEKQILQPLATEWDKFPDSQRASLLGVAKRYPAMNREEQSRIQVRLREWSLLTPEQRDLARRNFQNVKKLPPEQRKEVKKKLHQRQQEANTKPEPPAEILTPDQLRELEEQTKSMGLP